MLTIRGIQVDGRCEIGERGRLARRAPDDANDDTTRNEEQTRAP